MVLVHEDSASDDVLYFNDGAGKADDENGVATIAKEASVEEDRIKLRRVEMARRVVALRLETLGMPISWQYWFLNCQNATLERHRHLAVAAIALSKVAIVHAHEQLNFEGVRFRPHVHALAS